MTHKLPTHNGEKRSNFYLYYNACMDLQNNNNSFVGRSRPVVLFIL